MCVDDKAQVVSHPNDGVAPPWNFTANQELPCQPVNCTSEDEVMTRGWTFDYKKLSPDQKMFAKKAIQDVLFEAQLETLTIQSVRINAETKCPQDEKEEMFCVTVCKAVSAPPSDNNPTPTTLGTVQ